MTKSPFILLALLSLQPLSAQDAGQRDSIDHPSNLIPKNFYYQYIPEPMMVMEFEVKDGKTITHSFEDLGSVTNGKKEIKGNATNTSSGVYLHILKRDDGQLYIGRDDAPLIKLNNSAVNQTKFDKMIKTLAEEEKQANAFASEYHPPAYSIDKEGSFVGSDGVVIKADPMIGSRYLENIRIVSNPKRVDTYDKADANSEERAAWEKSQNIKEKTQALLEAAQALSAADPKNPITIKVGEESGNQTTFNVEDGKIKSSTFNANIYPSEHPDNQPNANLRN